MEENTKIEIMDRIYDVLTLSAKKVGTGSFRDWEDDLTMHEMEEPGSADPEVNKNGEITLHLQHKGKTYQIVLIPKMGEVR
jgi:hypothetical protein